MSKNGKNSVKFYWFRLQNTIIDHPKISRLSDSVFRFWVEVLCIASRYEGEIKEISFHLRMRPKRAQVLLDELIKNGLVDCIENRYYPHDWKDWQFKSDLSTERVRRFREKQKFPVSETQNETLHGNATETFHVTDEKRSTRVSCNGPELYIEKEIEIETKTKENTTHNAAKKTAAKNGAFILPEDVPAEPWDEWMKIRKAKKATNTDYAKTLLVKKLRNVSEKTHHSIAALIDMAIQRNWIGLEEGWIVSSNGNGSHPLTECTHKYFNPSCSHGNKCGGLVY